MSAEADPDQTNPPDPLVDRAVRLFSFLGRAQQLKSPSVSDLDSYRRDGAVHWLERPVHPAVQLAAGRSAPKPSDPVLTVDRVRRNDPPTPEAQLSAWIEGPSTTPVLSPYSSRSATCRSRRASRRPMATEGLPRVPRPTGGRRGLSAVPARVASLGGSGSPRRAARTFYGSLFSTYVTANGHPEELELVLGTGLLAWRLDPHAAVRRHLLVTPVKILLDDATGRLAVSVDETTDGVRLELEMLDPSLISDPQRVNAVGTTRAPPKPIRSTATTRASGPSARPSAVVRSGYRDEDSPQHRPRDRSRRSPLR